LAFQRRKVGRALLRTGPTEVRKLGRALVRTSLVETAVAGVLATMAFLVVFSLLIRDFFWMVTGRSSNLFSIEFHQRFVYCTSHAKPAGLTSKIAKPNNHNFLAALVLKFGIVPEGERFSGG
jgi:hypothetical protein